MRYKKRKYFLAGRINIIQRSKIRELFEKASKMENVISLGIGEPDFDTPDVIKDAAKRALDEGYTHYTPNAGIPEFREAIAEYYKDFYKVDVEVDNILVTAGAYEATYLAFQSILEQGDDVIIPDPAFVCYVEDAKIAEAGIIRIPLREENKFRLNPDELVEAITKRTRMIVINYPNNPTGAVMDKSTVKAIADIAQDYNIYILSDEPYEHFLYEGAKHYPMIKYAPDNTILANSFSKTFAMTGWRLGFVAAPAWVVEKMTRFQMYNATCPVTFVQYAAAKALDDPRSWKAVEEMRNEYDRRRNLVWKRLNEMGLPTVKPKGAFYIFPRIRDTGLTDKEFSELMLKEARVAVVPGSAFGKAGEGYIRISYATAYEKLEEAMDRMEKVLKEKKLV